VHAAVGERDDRLIADEDPVDGEDAAQLVEAQRVLLIALPATDGPRLVDRLVDRPLDAGRRFVTDRHRRAVDPETSRPL